MYGAFLPPFDLQGMKSVIVDLFAPDQIRDDLDAAESLVVDYWKAAPGGQANKSWIETTMPFWNFNLTGSIKKATYGYETLYDAVEAY